MKHAGPLHKVAPLCSDFSARDSSLINDEPSQASVNIAVIAENKAVAQSWIAQTLRHCKSGVEADEARYGRFLFHSCAYDQPLPAGDIHEAHVIVDTKASGIRWQDVESWAKRVFFHHIGGTTEADLRGGIHYCWSSPEAGSAFCGSLFSRLARPGIIGITWEDYADLLPDSASAQCLLSGAEKLDAAISALRNQAASPPSERATLALLHIEGNDCLSLGDYLDVCNAAEELLPSQCRLVATVFIAGQANRLDLQLALFSPSRSSSQSPPLGARNDLTRF